MRWKLPPKREDAASALLSEIAELLAPDIEAMAAHTGQKRAQCLATMLRPMINMECPNIGASAVVDRRQKEWSVQCTFGQATGASYDHASDGEFEAEVVRGFDRVIDIVRACVDDYHESTGIDWRDIVEFNDRNMKQRFGGLYSNISSGGGEASTRVFFDLGGVDQSFVDVTVERQRTSTDAGQKELDAETTNEDSAPSAMSRIRQMREARGQS